MISLTEAPRITTPKIQRAEKAVIDASQVAEDLKRDAAARQDRLDHLRRHRNQIATRLQKVEKRDLDAQLVTAEATVDRLYESHELNDHPRTLELISAVEALAWLPKLKAISVKVAARLKLELAEADAALAEMEKGD